MVVCVRVFCRGFCAVCPRVYSPGMFCPGGFCPGGFCPGGFVHGGGGVHRGVLSRGYCPGGGGCPRITLKWC